MHKRIFILEALLSIFFVCCTTSDSDGIIPSEQEVCINFSAVAHSDFTVNVGTRGATDEINIGILGVAASEEDSLTDCLDGVTDDSFCHNLYNTEFTGTFPGYLQPAEEIVPAFPLEDKSAIAVYAYSPYSPNKVVIGDTTCYINIDVAKEKFRYDYLYTGRIFKSKAAYSNDNTFALPFMHAFAKIDISFVEQMTLGNGEYWTIDTLQLITKSTGKGLFDLKNGIMLPDTTGEADTISFRTNIIDEPLLIDNENNEKNTTIYFPPVLQLDSVRITGYRWGNKFIKTYAMPIPDEGAQFERGKKYSMEFATPLEPEWSVVPSDYKYTMDAYISLQNDNATVDLSRYIIAAFCNDECRGVLETREHNGKQYGYMCLRSNVAQGETFSVRLFNRETRRIIYDTSVRIPFVVYATIGSIENPVVINIPLGI